MFSSVNSTPSLTRVPTPSATSTEEPSSPATTVSDCEGTVPVDDYSSDDIAIIGMSCRVPGGNNSPESLWNYLLQAGDASGDMPQFRWEPYNSRHPLNARTLAATTSKGYFLDRLEDFDASFFSISPHEAEQMDPQQRTVLETAWEALENAGIPPQRLSGSDTAVYMGVNSDDYGKLVLEDLQNIGAHMGVGTAYCGIPSRISYILNLMGPSIAIDAACASSLVAVHHARQAILAGETELAIAGGVNALIGPGLTRVLDEAGAIAADGKCRSFDDSAHGYGRGEGAGIVVLKRLDKAIADADRVLGVLKGSAVRADGKTLGIMAPNPIAQQLVAQKALQEAKLPAESISYIEAHATSTPLGDPTEMEALARVYGYGIRKAGSNPCMVGSIKSNIGHLEAGAGVLSLIKAVMVLQHGLVPPQANLEKLSTKINWADNMLKVCTDATKLPLSTTPARAAIASYGYSGTVSHAIIESFRPPHSAVRQEPNSPVLLFLSGPQEGRLTKAANALARWLETDGASAPLANVATTLASRRGHHRYRLAVAAADKADAIATLDTFSKSYENPSIISGRVAPEAAKGPVWVFSGHGAQWPEMGQELYTTQPTFAEIVDKLAPMIQEELGFSITQSFALGRMGSTDEIQIMTFVMHVGLAAVLLTTAGPPSAIVGHSLGETAAAVIAGVLTLDEGALIACRRARLYREVMGHGAMILVTLSASEVRPWLVDRQDISVAIEASPSSCVLSGAKDSISELSAELKQGGVQTRDVHSDVAFHSTTLLKLVDSLRQSLSDKIRPKPSKIPLYSTSSQDPRTKQPRDADYWVNNMVQPVLLRSTVEAIAEDGYRAFVEISSHPIVTHSIHETLENGGFANFITIPTMIRNRPTMKSILTSVGKMHCFGCTVAYTEQMGRPWLPEVPGTIWSHEAYWRTVAKIPSSRLESHDPCANDLLGTRTALWASDKVLFQTHLNEDNKPFPGKHPLHGSEIVPAAVLINTFLKAVPSNCLENMSLKVPVVVSPPRDVQVLVDTHQISLSSRLSSPSTESQEAGSWLVNTTSRVGATDAIPSVLHLDLEETKKRLTRVLPNNFSIDYLAKVGVPDMGFPWTVVEHIENDTEMLAKVEMNPEDISGMDSLRTSALDSATSIASTLFHLVPKLRMPTAVERIVASGDMNGVKVGYVYCKKLMSGTAADILVCSEAGQVLVELQAMAFAGIDGDEFSRKTAGGIVHRIAWTPAIFAEEPYSFSHIVFLTTENDQTIEAYKEQAEEKGYTASSITDARELVDLNPGTVVVHIPHRAGSKATIFEAASKSCESLISAVKMLTASPKSGKLFCLVDRNDGISELGYAPLYGLARIVKSEHPDIWGGLFEADSFRLPLLGFKYVQGEDVVRVEDGVLRTAHLRPFARKSTSAEVAKLQFRPGATYLITGGLGALGLEVAAWMAERGARRLLLVSRRKLPRRSTWDMHTNDACIQKIITLENLGATVHVLTIDMSASHADVSLAGAIEQLSVPPIAGVVHAAGLLQDQLVEEVTTDAFENVLAPKIIGALHLDSLFPPGTLDFFTLFSSCGQLLGFPGQASYASGNAFLDALAEKRRLQGDNSTAMMWTSWRGLGMAASTEYINAELNARGITDVTRDEAFMAWDYIASLDTDHAVVLGTLPLAADDPLPHSILRDIVLRQAPVATDSGAGLPTSTGLPSRPDSGPELEAYLSDILTECVAVTLGTSDSDIDPTLALSEMGMDSVLTVSFRSRVQQKLKITFAPTLVWKCPTVNHLVKHFAKELEK